MYCFVEIGGDNLIHLEFEIGMVGSLIAAVFLGGGIGIFVFKARSFYHKKSLLTISIQNHIFYFIVSTVSLLLDFRLIFTFAFTGKDYVNLSLLVIGVVADLLLASVFFLLIAQSRKSLERRSPFLSQFSLELYVDFTALHHKMAAVKLVSLLASMDANLLVFLPFRKSEFSERSFGYPTLWALKIIMLEKITVSALRIVGSVMASTADVNSIGLFFVSSLVLIVNVCECLMRMKAEDMIALDEKTRQVVNQLYRSRSASEHNAIELGDVRHSDDVDILDLMSDVHFRESFVSICDSLKEKNAAIRESLSSNTDVENPMYISSQKFADENLDLYKQQLKNAGMPIFEYMELSEIRREVKDISALIAQDMTFDEKRLDYLIGCMKLNKEFILEQEEIKRQEDINIKQSASEALRLIRSYVPPDVKQCTVAMLQSKGYSGQLAKRVMTVKALWLTRFSTALVNSLHVALLKSDFGFDGRNLDLVELLAVYASYPEKFSNDGNGQKQQYRDLLREKVQSLLSKEEGGVLRPNTRRHQAYRGQVGLFGDSDFVLPLDASASSHGAFDRDEDAFRKIAALRGQSTEKGFSEGVEMSYVAKDTGFSRSGDGDNTRDTLSTDKSPSVHADSRSTSTSSIGEAEFHKRLGSVSAVFSRRSSDSVSHASSGHRDASPDASAPNTSSSEPSPGTAGSQVAAGAGATTLALEEDEVSNPLRTPSSDTHKEEEV